MFFGLSVIYLGCQSLIITRLFVILPCWLEAYWASMIIGPTSQASLWCSSTSPTSLRWFAAECEASCQSKSHLTASGRNMNRNRWIQKACKLVKIFFRCLFTKNMVPLAHSIIELWICMAHVGMATLEGNLRVPKWFANGDVKWELVGWKWVDFLVS